MCLTFEDRENGLEDIVKEDRDNPLAKWEGQTNHPTVPWSLVVGSNPTLATKI